MSDPRQILINLVAGLTLADHMGDVWEDALEALKQAAVDLPEDLCCYDAEFGDWMARRHNATTVWGTSLLKQEGDHMTNEPTTPEVGEWIEWHGGDCPVSPEAVVQARFFDPDYWRGGNMRASTWVWDHVPNRGANIIAYRLVSPPAVQEEGLKHCPFCGGTAREILRAMPGEGSDVHCLNSDCDGYAASVSAWNRRPSPAIPDREEIVGVLREIVCAVDPLVAEPPIVGPVTQRVRDKLLEARSLLAKLEGKS